MSDVTSTMPHTSADAWQEIESLVDELTGLSKSHVTTREFYSELLDRAVRALAAVGGAVWLLNSERSLQLEYQINAIDGQSGRDSAELKSHATLLLQVLQDGKPRTLQPQSAAGTDSETVNTTPYLLLLHPIKVDEAPIGLLELRHDDGASPSVQRSYAEVLSVLAELASDFQQNRQLRDLRSHAANWERFDQFASSVHDSLEVTSTCYTIANEARQLLGCDRVSVGLIRGRKCRLQSVSGMDVVDRRATSVRALERLAAGVGRTTRPLRFNGDSTGLSDQQATLLARYLDETDVQSLWVVPLKYNDSSDRPRDVFAVLVIEQFERGETKELAEQPVTSVVRHSTSALKNATRSRLLPRALAKLAWPFRARRLLVMLVLLSLSGGAAAALTFAEADFAIEGRGELQPVEVRHFYAPVDGQVRALHLQPDPENPNLYRVAKGKLAIEIVNDELQRTLESNRLDIATAEEEERTRNLTKQELSQRTAEDRRKYGELVSELKVLEVRIAGLKKLEALLTSQQEKLSLKSEIDGEVLTWDVYKQLLSRPVLQGQQLMTVANTSGRWVLEVDVPDHDIGHVLDASEAQDDDLRVVFLLKTDPSTEYEGTVVKIARSADAHPQAESTVKVTVAIDRSDLPEIRPGTEVVAKIECGRRPLGYVWLHDLFDAVRSRILF